MSAFRPLSTGDDPSCLHLRCNHRKHTTLTQYCFNAGPAQHLNIIGTSGCWFRLRVWVCWSHCCSQAGFKLMALRTKLPAFRNAIWLEPSNNLTTFNIILHPIGPIHNWLSLLRGPFVQLIFKVWITLKLKQHCYNILCWLWIWSKTVYTNIEQWLYSYFARLGDNVDSSSASCRGLGRWICER